MSGRLIAPYATWMALMMALPASAGAYALRTAATAAVLLFFFAPRWRAWTVSGRGVLIGALAGLAVFALWIAPETVFRGLLPTWLFPLAPATDVSIHTDRVCSRRVAVPGDRHCAACVPTFTAAFVATHSVPLSPPVVTTSDKSSNASGNVTMMRPS